MEHSTGAMVSIRRLEPHEVQLHRQVRLRALQEAPASFGHAFEDIVVEPDGYWDALTVSVTGSRQILLLAESGPVVVGCVYGLADRATRETGRIDRLRPGSAREIIEMRLVLPAAG
ncbi:MAG: hypothetical protein ABWZ78_08630 [Burkholderiaceae bacterium]